MMKDDPLVKIAEADSEPIALMWQELLADQGIRSLAKAVAGGAHSYIPAGASPHHIYVLRSEAEKAKSILGLEQDEDVVAGDDGDGDAE